MADEKMNAALQALAELEEKVSRTFVFINLIAANALHAQKKKKKQKKKNKKKKKHTKQKKTVRVFIE